MAGLAPLALDLHWAWSHAGDALWKRVDLELWEQTRNPWLVLQYVSHERLDRLAEDADFVRDLRAFAEAEASYRSGAGWRPSGVTTLPRVAYFSMEFGLDEALPLYAGGLGVLAGDHLKTASDLGVPVVGVGILWQQGYFRQLIDAGANQAETYPYNEPTSLPVQPVFGPAGERLRVSLNLPGRTILLRTWQVTLGRTRLYLLDSNDPLNAPSDRGLTSALYGGGPEARLMQSIVLGVGGWRLLEALGLDIEVCHLNEGHAAFVVVERARYFMEQHRTTFREALWATRAGNVFTTHTAVPAGFDAFSTGQVETHRPYFDEYVSRLGLSWPELLVLGRRNPDDASEPFNMAWLAVRGCATVNGVSRLHGAVSRRLFAPLFPRWPGAEVPIGHVTNAVHVPSWDSPWTDDLWTRAAGKARWRGDVSALSVAISSLADEDLWRVRAHERQDLVRYARERVTRRLVRRAHPEQAQSTAGSILHPEALTLGFARRFSAYKRPNLLLSDPERLLRLLTRDRQPVQLIVAGKAHPRDEAGKAFIRQWIEFVERPEARAHVVFLEDYDMRLASEMVQGVDVWINTPRRPWEACGTSGMKLLVNGGLNLSVLDGWWAEAFDPACGWALGDGLEHPEGEWDLRDAGQLYTLLEEEVVPAFFERDAAGLPRRWIAMMRASMARLAPQYSSVRMLQEYVEHAYLPAAVALRRRLADGVRLGRELDQWSRHLSAHWADIRFGDVTDAVAAGRLSVSVPVHLGA
ncbi:MAG: alpha-glucan family phosphorylase, partial [Acidobacteriota bacterium]|nr:alpha-glucan family phosphorylase [Acidobacteriota bacterium]